MEAEYSHFLFCLSLEGYDLTLDIGREKTNHCSMLCIITYKNDFFFYKDYIFLKKNYRQTRELIKTKTNNNK